MIHVFMYTKFVRFNIEGVSAIEALVVFVVGYIVHAVILWETNIGWCLFLISGFWE